MPVVRNARPEEPEKQDRRPQPAKCITLPSPEGIYKGEKVIFINGKLIVGDVVVSTRENI